MQTNPFTDPATPSMAYVLERIREDMALSDNRRAEVASAIRTASRWFDMPLAAMPAHPDFLRRHFDKFAPAKFNVTKKRLANVRSAIMAALRHLDLVGAQHYLCPLDPAWKRLRKALPDKYAWSSLSRFFHYCSANGILPERVNNDLMAKFLEAMVHESLVKDPRVSHQNACRAWNKMRDTVDCWPGITLAVPTYNDRYSFGWDTFPENFQKDVETFLERQQRPDPLDINAPIRPLRSRTIEAYRYDLRRAASALVLRGCDPEKITSLAVLVDLDNVEQILRFLIERNNGKATKSAADLARLLAKVARNWVGSDEVTVKQINRFAANITPASDGLSARNRKRLAPLREERNMVRLFLLPRKIQKDLARRNHIQRRHALLVQQAVALSILTYCPLRIGNVAALHLDVNLRWSGPNMSGGLLVDIEGESVKNGQTLSFPLPQDCAELVKLYIERFRPLLFDGANPYLFPSNRPGRPKRADTLSRQLSRLIRDSLGLEVNPHLYRHLVHIIVLRRYPGAYAMISRILGHKSLGTAIANYAGEDIAIALRAFQELVSDTVSGKTHTRDAPLAKRVYALNEAMV